jgi:hypothetical protein
LIGPLQEVAIGRDTGVPRGSAVVYPPNDEGMNGLPVSWGGCPKRDGSTAGLCATATPVSPRPRSMSFAVPDDRKLIGALLSGCFVGGGSRGCTAPTPPDPADCSKGAQLCSCGRRSGKLL